MKVDFAKSYRGVSGKAIAEAVIQISQFTRGAARGGYGTWARGAFQIAGLIPAKAYLTSLGDFVATCRAMKPDHIATIQSAADVKFASSKASDKRPVERLRDSMKRLDCEAFALLAHAVETLQRAGFTTVEYWLEQPDGADVARVDSIANVINDTFYRNVSNSQRGNAIAARGIGNGKATDAKVKVAA